MRLGDLDALKAELLRLGFFPAIVKSAIERMPTADAKPVVHGRFVDGECTICGWFGDCCDTPHYNFCPNCGAYMLNKRFIFDESDDQKLRSFICSIPIENKRRTDDG